MQAERVLTITVRRQDDPQTPVKSWTFPTVSWIQLQAFSSGNRSAELVFLHSLIYHFLPCSLFFQERILRNGYTIFRYISIFRYTSTINFFCNWKWLSSVSHKTKVINKDWVSSYPSLFMDPRSTASSQLQWCNVILSFIFICGNLDLLCSPKAKCERPG